MLNNSARPHRTKAEDASPVGKENTLLGIALHRLIALCAQTRKGSHHRLRSHRTNPRAKAQQQERSKPQKRETSAAQETPDTRTTRETQNAEKTNAQIRKIAAVKRTWIHCKDDLRHLANIRLILQANVNHSARAQGLPNGRVESRF